MRNVGHGSGEQLRLAVAHELAHRSVDAEETGTSGVDLELAYATDIEHSSESRIVLKALLNLCELDAALFNALVQFMAELAVAFNSKAQPGNEDDVGECHQDKQQKSQHFSVER